MATVNNPIAVGSTTRVYVARGITPYMVHAITGRSARTLSGSSDFTYLLLNAHF